MKIQCSHLWRSIERGAASLLWHSDKALVIILLLTQEINKSKESLCKHINLRTVAQKRDPCLEEKHISSSSASVSIPLRDLPSTFIGEISAVSEATEYGKQGSFKMPLKMQSSILRGILNNVYRNLYNVYRNF